ncbi:Uncharacterised protein [Chlamydia trachomatis]|nr:Uncharacterised protein [Chlamydia trachomatis]
MLQVHRQQRQPFLLEQGFLQRYLPPGMGFQQRPYRFEPRKARHLLVSYLLVLQTISLFHLRVYLLRYQGV